MHSRRTLLYGATVRTRIAALALLILSACATSPVNNPTILPPGQLALLPAPQVMPPPQSIPEKLQPSTLDAAANAVTTAPVIANVQVFIPPAPVEPAPVAVATPPDYFESFASYYAKRFNGRRTFSGERYDPEGMTAATRDFPLQSWLKVINPANGKEVTVRVNDRTGKRKTPLIDLSRAAARELGFLGKGKIRVHVIPVLPTPLLSASPPEK